MFKKWKARREEKRRYEIELEIKKYHTSVFSPYENSVTNKLAGLDKRINKSEQDIALIHEKIKDLQANQPPKELIELFTTVLNMRGEFMYKLAQGYSEDPPPLTYFFDAEKTLITNICKKNWKDKSNNEINDLINLFYGQDDKAQV